MRHKLAMLVFLSGMTSCDTKSHLINATVIDRDEDLFAEWGTDEQGRKFENRFVGVKVTLQGQGVQDTAWLVQIWPEADRMPMPKTGEVLHLAELPADSKALPLEGRSYWYRELKLMEPEGGTNESQAIRHGTE